MPDAAGLAATARMLDLLRGLGPDDFVLALISGGASSLLCAPRDGISLAQKQAINAALLASGAPIGQMNVLRKHLSNVKGGQLAAAASPARMLALMISDVPGDDPALIGSGPTVGETSTAKDALAVAAQWGIALPPPVMAALQTTITVGAGDPRLNTTTSRVIAAPAQSLAAARVLAQTHGCDVRMIGAATEGEARDVAAAQAAYAMEIAAGMRPGAAPILLLSGGELTVTQRGRGVGGPNAEFCLALAIALNGHPDIHAIACDTDGVDGAAEVAGAVVTPTTLARSVRDANQALAQNDAHSFFAALGDQVITGPTLTNVNDFRAILIQSPK